MARLDELSWLRNHNYCISVDQFLGNCLTVKEIGLWAAEMMGMSAEEAADYAHELVDNDIELGRTDFISKLKRDFQARGITISDHRLDMMIERKHEVAVDWVSHRFWKAMSAEGWERRRRQRVETGAKPLPPVLQEWKQHHTDTA